MVAWTLEKGEEELNRNLKKKYKADLNDLEQIEDKKAMEREKEA